MRHVLRGALVAVLLLGLAASVAAQSVTTGSVQGTIKDPEGGVLPGATVTAYSDALITGRAIAVTDNRGLYRFPSLPVGSYAVEAELSGFQTVRREGVRIQIGQALSIDFVLPIAKVKEEIMVTAEAPVVSVVSNTVSTSFDTGFLDRQPVQRNYYSLLSAAPGVTIDITSSAGSSMMAYGGTSQSQNAYTLDGVNVADPASAEYWLLPSIQWMQEIQIGGLGANAEYGGYTGGVINGVTKSGGNEFHGGIEYYYQPESWVSNNDPTGEQSKSKFTDAAVSLGGPVVKDKLWYFVSGEYWRQQQKPVGAIEADDRKVPRYLGKLTLQTDPANRFSLMAEHDNLTHDRRGIDQFTLPDATSKETSPNYTFALAWESLLNASNFIDLKLTGFDGRLDFLPYHGFDTPGRYDTYSGYSWVNQGTREQNHRHLVTLDAAWSLFQDGLFATNDSHAFKVGASYEKSSSSDNWTDNGGFVYWDDSSLCPGNNDDERLAAYFADPECGAYYTEAGYENYHEWLQTSTINLYAQDTMRLDRLTINYGARYGNYKGGFQSGHGNTDVYNATFVDPRIGLVWDVSGDSRTALKAHWGRYHEKMLGYLFDREASGKATTGYIDCYWNSDTGAYDDCSTTEPQYARMGSYGHQYVDEALLTAEQQLGRNMVVGVDLIDRRWHDIMGMVNANNDYELVIAHDNPLTGGDLPIYNLLSPQDWVLTTDNPAYRKYQSVMLRFNKRYADGWSLMSSLVWTDLKGNEYKNNGYVNELRDRNGLTNADGRIDLSFNKWEFKLSGAVDLPFGIQASGQYTYMSGMYWQPYVRIRGLDYNGVVGRNIYLVPRGSYKFPDRNLIDLRLAWSHKFSGGLGLTASLEGFNLLNKSTVLNVSQQWGTYRISSGSWSQTSSYGEPTTIENPRQVRAGIRIEF
ncbi:MAG: TonB-dependent receptor [Acidobacteriota bacterium]